MVLRLLNICSFLLTPPSKTLPQFFTIAPQAEENYPFLSNSIFWRAIFPKQKGEARIMELKKYQNSTYEGIGHKFW